MENIQSGHAAQIKTMNSAEVYGALKESILTLKLRPGQMISENEVAKSYNVSRTPVKSAFIRLEGEGFIEVIPQKGTYVTLIDCAHIRAIIYMRYVLEADMLKAILQSPSVADVLDKLEENLKEQERMVRWGEPSPYSFFELDSRFHAILFKYAGRENIWSIIQANQVYYTRFRLLDTQSTSRYDQLYQEHLVLLQAIKDRDLPRFEKCMYDHLHYNISFLIKTIKGEYRDYLINY